jgi:transglutaminase-like putative cysteine protease
MKPLLLVFLGLLSALSLAAEPSAVSRAFVSDDPIVVQARGLLDAGKFTEAAALLKANINPPDSSATRDRQDTLDIIHRIRFEYSLTAAGLLAKIQESIPDATQAEAVRWAAESKVRFRMIDGQKFFFRYEPENIFLFDKEAIERRARAGHAPAEPKWQLLNHLTNIVDESEATGKTEVQPVHHKITHTLTIHANLPGVKANSLVRVWLPFPQEYRQQRNVKLLSASPKPKLIAPSAVEGNPVTGAAQRTIYFEQRVVDPAEPLKFKIVFAYDSFAYYPKLDPARVQSLPADWNGACLNERLPHIAFTPEIRSTVAAVVGNETNALIKARKIFHWVSDNIPWNAEDEYCIIPSFAVKGFTSRRGDCGVQNTVFVTMCRLAGIPARWQSGFETRPNIGSSMHDWSEIYIAPWGWLPTDAAYGVKKSSDPRVADFYCGHQDSYRMIINLDWGRDLFPPKLSQRSEPADFQRGEVEVDGKNLYYDQWDYHMKVEQTAGAQSE